MEILPGEVNQITKRKVQKESDEVNQIITQSK
jgi:hypothetical protein